MSGSREERLGSGPWRIQGVEMAPRMKDVCRVLHGFSFAEGRAGMQRLWVVVSVVPSVDGHWEGWDGVCRTMASSTTVS